MRFARSDSRPRRLTGGRVELDGLRPSRIRGPANFMQVVSRRKRVKQRKTDSVRATETSVAIISAIEELDGEATITEISNHLQLAKSTVYKHLATLERSGIVVEYANGYRIGLRCLKLGGIARQYDDVYAVAKSEIQKMAESTGELANLMFEEQGYGVYVYTARGDQAVDLDRSLGKRVYLHTTALGKALLSSLSDARVREIVAEHGLPAETDETITTEGELFEELEKIRRDGFAYNREERIGGLGCVGVPLETGDGRNAAISIATPISRLDPEEMRREYTKILKQTANVIEVNLAHRS